MICTFTPDASQPEIYYDLSLADEALTGNLRVAIKNEAGAITGDIYTRICRPPTVTCGQGSYVCDSAQKPCISNPAAIDVYNNGAKCVAPGHLSNHVWSLQNPNDIKGGAQITFSGGDPARGGSGGLQQRQYVMQFECDSSVNYPQAVSGTESTSASTITYTVVVRTSGACVLQPLPPPLVCPAIIATAQTQHLMFSIPSIILVLVPFLSMGLCPNPLNERGCGGRGQHGVLALILAVILPVCYGLILATFPFCDGPRYSPDPFCTACLGWWYAPIGTIGSYGGLISPILLVFNGITLGGMVASIYIACL